MRRSIGLIAALASAGLMAPAGRHSGGRTTRTAGKRKPARKRLQMARGAGSINAKADILQLVRAGRRAEAAAMAREHERQCGERLFPGLQADEAIFDADAYAWRHGDEPQPAYPFAEQAARS